MTLKLAPHVARVIAVDVNPSTLQTARTLTAGQGVTDVNYTVGDAGTLPFATGSFDLITCRLAAHHFPDCFGFVRDCARVLKPAGRLVIQDHLAPDDDCAARYINAFERLRAPDYNRAYNGYEWRGMYLDAGLTIERDEIFRLPGIKLLTWAERKGCSAYVIERLQILLVQAPSAVADWMQPHCAGRPDATFSQPALLIAGIKPS
jgi:SAM-dependent methyltransferase